MSYHVDNVAGKSQEEAMDVYYSFSYKCLGKLLQRNNHDDFSQLAMQGSIQDHEPGLYFVTHHQLTLLISKAVLQIPRVQEHFQRTLLMLCLYKQDGP